MEKIIIAVDAMGGDNAPSAVVGGCVAALRDMDDIRIRLFGTEDAVRACLTDAEDVRDRIEIVPCSQVITMHDQPMIAVRRMTDSSIVRGMTAVREKTADAFVSAGSTGAILAGGILRAGRIYGIERPALAPVLPGLNGPICLIDSGANADCQPKYLAQFGLMGWVYMSRVYHIPSPRVGLVNIGAEEEKGNKLYKDAHALMKAQTAYPFAGNCEARDVSTGDYQVVVADGFTGNIILKYAEGFSATLLKMLKSAMRTNRRAKLGAMLMRGSLRAFKHRMDTDEYGGAPLLGVDGVIVKAHGASRERAIEQAVRQARNMVQSEVVRLIREGLSELNKTDINNQQEDTQNGI